MLDFLSEKEEISMVDEWDILQVFGGIIPFVALGWLFRKRIFKSRRTSYAALLAQKNQLSECVID
jgi:hypothetical protein